MYTYIYIYIYICICIYVYICIYIETRQVDIVRNIHGQMWTFEVRDSTKNFTKSQWPRSEPNQSAARCSGVQGCGV